MLSKNAQKLKIPTSNRLLIVAQALREGLTPLEINEICGYDLWFIEQIESAILVENKISFADIISPYYCLFLLIIIYICYKLLILNIYY